MILKIYKSKRLTITTVITSHFNDSVAINQSSMDCNYYLAKKFIDRHLGI